MKQTEEEKEFLSILPPEHRLENYIELFINYWLNIARQYNYYHMAVIEYIEFLDKESKFLIVQPMCVFTEVSSLFTFLTKHLKDSDIEHCKIGINSIDIYYNTSYSKVTLSVSGLPLNTVSVNRGYECKKFEM